ncbi:MAG: S41 family peptidase [Brevundimonas sp.]
MRPVFPLLLLGLILPAGTVRADPACAAVLGKIRQAVETDYVGYAVAIAPEPARLAAYQAFAVEAERRAQTVAPTDCTHALRRFVGYFDDPHLFVLERPELAAAQAEAYRTAHAPRPVPPAPAADLEGLQGVWVAPEFDIHVVPEGTGRHVAIVAAARDDAWHVGDVAARFVETDGTIQATVYRSEDRAPIRYAAALQRDGMILHMPPLSWGRRLDTADASSPFDPSRPRAPTFAPLGDRAAIVALPSFSPEHRQAIVDLVSAHDADIRARPLLIIDLRGNDGGSTALARPLAPYYASANMAPATGPRVHPHAVSSPRIIRYYSNIRDSLPQGQERAFYDDFIARMQARPGRLVPYFEDQALAAMLLATPAPETIHPTPQHVAILVDRHSVSAAEAVLIEARRSARVTVFGEPTGGSIDYQNVTMFSVGEGEMRHLLGLPVVAASDELPGRGFNATGVPVDVDLTGQADWVSAVLSHYGLAD